MNTIYQLVALADSYNYDVTDLTDGSVALKAKRSFRKFSYRGVDLEQYVHRSSRIPDRIHKWRYADGM